VLCRPQRERDIAAIAAEPIADSDNGMPIAISQYRRLSHRRCRCLRQQRNRIRATCDNLGVGRNDSNLAAVTASSAGAACAEETRRAPLPAATDVLCTPCAKLPDV
jgi:hypothetical protein